MSDRKREQGLKNKPRTCVYPGVLHQIDQGLRFFSLARTGLKFMTCLSFLFILSNCAAARANGTNMESRSNNLLLFPLLFLTMSFVLGIQEQALHRRRRAVSRHIAQVPAPEPGVIPARFN